MAEGRHASYHHAAAVDTATPATVPATSAQMPAPAMASEIPTTPLTTALAMVMVASRPNCMVRRSRA